MSKAGEPKRVPDPKLPKKRRSAVSRVLLSLFLLTILAGLLAAGAAFYAYQEYTLPGPLAENKVLEIGRGLSTPQIAAQLEEGGIISDARVFSTMAYVNGTRSRLKAGEYEFPAQATMRDVMALLASGKSITYKLSIPEGWTSEMAVARVEANEILTGQVTAPPPEGAIMPDTYVFKRGMTRQKLLEDMQTAQTKLLDDLWERRSPVLAIKTREEALILASIVEKETARADERPVIASVFMNRLRKGMRLQSDPTIIYGMVGGKGKLDRPLTRTDIRTPTPYNTYTINGLPPGPIANPGRAALEAVLNPPDTDYLYFVADGSGGHAFAATLEEHNRNVAEWRKLASSGVSASTEDPATDGSQAEAATSDSPPETAPATGPDAAVLPAIEESAPEAEAAAQPESPVAPSTETPAAETAETTRQPEEQPQLQPRFFEPGSVIKVGGKLVAIPRPKPGR